MNNALLYIGAFLVMVLAALFAVPAVVDWNSYRGVFEEEASRILGRDVRVGGSVNLRLLPAPYVSFERLKISDPDGETGESFFRAESFTMWLSVPPLLQGVLEANKVEVKRPVLKLAANADGSGNWSALKINPGLMPFVPKGVALQSVTVVDGAVSLGLPQRPEIARFEAINGELAAESLQGPYKFSGTLNWGASRREVRLATGAWDETGELRLKTTVRALDTGNTYVLNGRIASLTGKPHLEGELSGTVLASLGDAAPAAEVETIGGTAASVPDIDAAVEAKPALLPESAMHGGATFDLKAQAAGDINGLVLTDIALTLAHDGPPQLISGVARLAWPDRMKLEADLTSRWLDLDRLAAKNSMPSAVETNPEAVAAVATAPPAVPLEVARSLFEALAYNLPDEADTKASFTLDQVTLGGESISNVRLAAARSDGPLELKEVRASLPGGTRLSVDGRLEGAPQARTFDGRLSISGQSLARFMTWGLRQPSLAQGRADGAFSLEGRMMLASKAIEVRDATLEIAGMPLGGELKLGFGDRKKLAISVEGDRIDLGHLWPGSLDPKVLVGAVTAIEEKAEEGPQVDNKPAWTSWLNANTMDLNVRVRATELRDGDLVLSDVDADVGVENGAFRMPALKFVASNGLSLDLEGEAMDLPAQTRGGVRGTVSAPTADAIESIVRFLDLPAGPAGRFASFAPLRIAGNLRIGERKPGSADVRLDGAAGQGRISGNILLDGGWAAWRTAPSNITVIVDSANIVSATRALVSETGGEDSTTSPLRGRLLIKASGIASGGLMSLASLRSDGLAVDYQGRAMLAGEAPMRLTGDVKVQTTDARSALAIVGVPLGRKIASTSIDGMAAIEVSDGKLSIKPRSLDIGGSKMSGVITLARTQEGAGTTTADLDIDAATVPGLLDTLLEAAPAVAQEPPASQATKTASDSKSKQPASPTPAPQTTSAEVLGDTQSVWPEEAFDTGIFDRLSGKIVARFGSLALEPGLAISDVRLEAGLQPGRIEVESLTGKALGGAVTSRLTWSKAAAGIGLTGALAINIGSPAPSNAASAPASADAVAFKLDFAGRGLTPTGVLTDLKGKGTLTLADVSLNGNSPAAVGAVAQSVLDGTLSATGDALTTALKAALKEGSLPLGKITSPVIMADGALKLEKMKIETPEGRSSFETVVELGTMRIDSEWQIEPKVAPASGAQASRVMLPAVTVAYVGKLRDVATLEPTIVTSGIERELGVRKMEREVEELERLRKLDQARAKAEEDRQKELEAVRAKQQGAGPAASPQPAPAPGQQPGAQGVPEGAADGLVPPTATPAAGASGVPVDATVEDQSVGATADGSAGQVGANEQPNGLGQPEPRSPVRKKKPVDDAWRPFQMTPY